jgi:hypothetical protein
LCKIAEVKPISINKSIIPRKKFTKAIKPKSATSKNLVKIETCNMPRNTIIIVENEAHFKLEIVLDFNDI